MTDESRWILFAIPQAATFLFYCAALVFVLTKDTDRHHAKKFAVAAIALLILLQPLGFVLRATALYFLPLEDMVYVSAGMYVVNSLVHTSAVCLFVVAAFAKAESEPEVKIPRRVQRDTDNPYAAPTS